MEWRDAMRAAEADGKQPEGSDRGLHLIGGLPKRRMCEIARRQWDDRELISTSRRTKKWGHVLGESAGRRHLYTSEWRGTR